MGRWWTALLSAYLLVWVPLRFAGELFASLPSMDMRGPPAVLELGAHALVAMLCAAGGWMLRTGAPAALAFAAAGVAASGAMYLQSLAWTVLPRDTAPGQRLPLALLVCAHTAFWLVMIAAARRRAVS